MEWWVWALFKIILINMILSGDNALVIAMASQQLPEKQKRLAIFWGVFTAIMLRVILIIGVIQLLTIPYLMAIGSLFLFWIAVKLVHKEEKAKHISVHTHLHNAIMTIIVADFIMSLDNVLAVAAIAQGNLLLIAIGIVLSIPLILWGSNLLVHLLNRFPWLMYAGASILAFTSGDMLLRDAAFAKLIAEQNALHLTHFLPISLASIVLLIPLYSKISRSTQE